jgi:hypothetical protein
MNPTFPSSVEKYMMLLEMNPLLTIFESSTSSLKKALHNKWIYIKLKPFNQLQFAINVHALDEVETLSPPQHQAIRRLVGLPEVALPHRHVREALQPPLRLKDVATERVQELTRTPALALEA